MKLLRSAAACVLLLGLSNVRAHPAPFSYIDLYLDEQRVRGEVVLHDYDLAHELGVTPPEALSEGATAPTLRGGVESLLDARLRVVIGGRALKLVWDAIEPLPERQSIRATFEISGAVGRLQIGAKLFPYDPNHQTFINVYERGALTQQAILNAHAHIFDCFSGSAQGVWAVVRAFMADGARHIFNGPDHLLFLAALLLLGGSLRRVALIVTAFTLGHSVTLSLAVLDIVRVASSIVEPLIALTVIVVGVDAYLISRRRRKSREADGGPAEMDLRPGLAAAFGLIHGFGFAAALTDQGLPRAALGWSLASFNVGVELGQLVVVTLLVAALTWLRRHRAHLLVRVELVGSLLVTAAGVYWFIVRMWPPAAGSPIS